jgi:nucleoside-diphosphate-sugar epimerase
MRGSKKRILVTGASGFIGSRCVPLLAEAGFEVHAVTSRPGGPGGSSNISWHPCDVLDPSACIRAIETIRPTHLMHLAWIATPGQFWSDPSNLRWLASGVTLVDFFFRNGGKRALGVGTCAEYAWDGNDSDEETTALNPTTIYGRCKLALGLAFAAAAAAYGGSAAWARLFYPYGPGEAPERFIPYVIQGLLEGKAVDCSRGTQIRDFIYVDDVTRALVCLLDSTAEGSHNIGSGSGISLREVAGIITARLGHAELVRFGVREPIAGDPERVVAAIGKIRQQTGWAPAVAIEEGIVRSIAACRLHPER